MLIGSSAHSRRLQRAQADGFLAVSRRWPSCYAGILTLCAEPPVSSRPASGSTGLMIAADGAPDFRGSCTVRRYRPCFRPATGSRRICEVFLRSPPTTPSSRTIGIVVSLIHGIDAVFRGQPDRLPLRPHWDAATDGFRPTGRARRLRLHPAAHRHAAHHLHAMIGSRAARIWRRCTWRICDAQVRAVAKPVLESRGIPTCLRLLPP